MPAGGHAPGSLGGNKGKLAPAVNEPHTEHGANIQGPVESGGHHVPYQSGGHTRYSPPAPKAKPHYLNRPTGSREGQPIHHTPQPPAITPEQRNIITSLLSGHLPSQGHSLAETPLLATLHGLSSPKAASAAGEGLGAVANLIKGLVHQEAAALETRPRNIAKTQYSGLESVPGDVLGAAKHTAHDVGDVIHSVLHPKFLRGYEQTQSMVQGGNLEHRLGILADDVGGAAGAVTHAVQDLANKLPGSKGLNQNRKFTQGAQTYQGLTDVPKDLAELPAQTLAAGYLGGKDVLHAVTTGDPGPLLKLGKSFVDNEPITQALLHGNLKPLQQHPAIALAELSGARNAGFRVAGGIGRGLGAETAPFRLAEEPLKPGPGMPASRPGRTVVGSNTVIPHARVLSRDPVERAIQETSPQISLHEAAQKPTLKKALKVIPSKKDAAAGHEPIVIEPSKHGPASPLERAVADVHGTHTQVNQEAAQVHNKFLKKLLFAGHSIIGRSKPIEGNSLLNPFVQGMLPHPDRIVAHDTLGERIPFTSPDHPVAQEVRSLVKQYEMSSQYNRLGHGDVVERNIQQLRSALNDRGGLKFDPGPVAARAIELAKDENSRAPAHIRHGDITPEQARQAKLIPHAVISEGFHLDPESHTIVDGHGHAVSHDDLEARLLESKGYHPNEIAYVSHKQAAAGESHGPAGARPLPETRERSGQAILQGTADLSPDWLTRSLAWSHREIGLHEAHDATITALQHNKAGVKSLLDDFEKRFPKIADRYAPEIHDLRARLASDVRGVPGAEGATLEPQGYWRGNRATEDAAKDAAIIKDLYARAGEHVDLTPVQLGHSFGPRRAAAAVAAHIGHGSGDHEVALNPDLEGESAKHLTEGWLNPREGVDAVTLMPRQAVDALHVFNQATNAPLRVAGAAGRAFSVGNLALSTKHILGEAFEISQRLLMSGAGLQAVRAGRLLSQRLKSDEFRQEVAKAYKPEWEKQLGRHIDDAELKDKVDRQIAEFKARTTRSVAPAGQLVDLLDQHAREKAVSEADDLRAKLKEPGALGMGVPRHIGGLYWNGVKGLVRLQRQLIEHTGAKVMLGHIAYEDIRRQAAFMDRTFGGLEKAVNDWALGHVGTDNQIAAARLMIEQSGRWSKHPAEYQRWLTVAPFGQWYVNSAKFLYWTMPRDHPIKTALLAMLVSATTDERKKYGLTLFGPVEKQLAGFEQGSLPIGGKQVGAQYYSPAAVASEFPQSALDMILPETSNVYGALRNTDYKNQPLEGLHGALQPEDPMRFQVAGNALLEAFFPPARIYRTIAEGGKPPADTSTVWKTQTFTDAKPSTLEGILHAFRPWRQSKPVFKKASGRQSGGGGKTAKGGLVFPSGTGGAGGSGLVLPK